MHDMYPRYGVFRATVRMSRWLIYCFDKWEAVTPIIGKKSKIMPYIIPI